MEVVLYGPLRGVTGEKSVKVPFEGGTVEEAIAAYVTAYPRAHDQLYTDDDSLRPSVRVQCDGETVTATDPCPAEATLTLFPAVQGG